MLKRSRILVVLLALAPGCSKGRAQADGAAPVADGVALLPAEARVVIGADVTRLRASPLAGRFGRWLLAQDPEQGKAVESIVALCKLDPARDLASVLLGKGEGADEVVVIARGAIDEGALLACARQLTTEKGGRLDARKAHGRTVHVAATPGARPIAFVVERGVLIVAMNEAWLDRVLDPAQAKLPQNPQMMALIGRIDAKVAGWGAGLVPEAGAKLVERSKGRVEKPPTSVTLEVAADDGLGVVLVLDMQSEADATRLAEYLSSQQPWLAILAQKVGLGRVMGKMVFAPEGNRVKMGARLDAEDVADIGAALDELAKAN